MKILITGGTGFLGSELIYELLRQNHEIYVTTRQSMVNLGPRPYKVIPWPAESEADRKTIAACDAVINLAGESIAEGRWTTARKEALRNSRIQFTYQLVDLLRDSLNLKVFLSSSAIGFYGDRKTEVLTEESPVGRGFLAELCKEWESTALELKRPGLRTVLLRTGIVLARGQGAFREFENLVKLNAGGAAGSGQQMMSWVHVQDWVHAVIHCLNNSAISGPVNIVAPQAVSQKAFQHLNAQLHNLEKWQLPAPACAIRIALGEMACIALDSQNVRPEKLTATGYKFKYVNLDDALMNIYDYEEQNHQIHEYFSAHTWLPAPLEKVFEFFSDAQNLSKITPPEMHFKVLKMSTEKIMSGTLIDYDLRIHGVPTGWRTLILNWQPPHKFTDTQERGPYKLWHHTHSFESLAGGTLMRDCVHYRLPMGKLGRIFGLPLVKHDIKKIFGFRRKTMLEKYSRN